MPETLSQLDKSVGFSMDPVPGSLEDLCRVSWERATGRSCGQEAVYRVWLTGGGSGSIKMCADHAARWRSAGGVRRIAAVSRR